MEASVLRAMPQQRPEGVVVVAAAGAFSGGYGVMYANAPGNLTAGAYAYAPVGYAMPQQIAAASYAQQLPGTYCSLPGGNNHTAAASIYTGATGGYGYENSGDNTGCCGFNGNVNSSFSSGTREHIGDAATKGRGYAGNCWNNENYGGTSTASSSYSSPGMNGTGVASTGMGGTSMGTGGMGNGVMVCGASPSGGMGGGVGGGRGSGRGRGDGGNGLRRVQRGARTAPRNSGRRSQCDSDDSWRSRTVEEADAAIDAISSNRLPVAPKPAASWNAAASPQASGANVPSSASSVSVPNEPACDTSPSALFSPQPAACESAEKQGPSQAEEMQCQSATGMDTKNGVPGMLRLEGWDDWMLCLRPRAEGERNADGQLTPARRSVTIARGRGGGRAGNNHGGHGRETGENNLETWASSSALPNSHSSGFSAAKTAKGGNNLRRRPARGCGPSSSHEDTPAPCKPEQVGDLLKPATPISPAEEVAEMDNDGRVSVMDSSKLEVDGKDEDFADGEASIAPDAEEVRGKEEEEEDGEREHQEEPKADHDAAIKGAVGVFRDREDTEDYQSEHNGGPLKDAAGLDAGTQQDAAKVVEKQDRILEHCKVVAGPWTGGWERAFRHDDELLRTCGLWCKKVEADGACLFRAFSDQLEGDGGSMHAKYRSCCVTFLEAHKADFAPFVEGGFKGYCARLRDPTAWGGHVEAQALSRALGVNALIHIPSEAPSADDVPGVAIEVLNFAEDAKCVQLCFHPRYHAGPHYNSVRCAGDSGDSAPPPSSVVELRERMTEALQAWRQKQASFPQS